jgi:hypothetical protein
MRLRVCYIRIKLKITNGGQVYGTSASRSAAEVGVAEAAPASRGGTDPLVAGVEEIGAVPVVEATEGEIIDMMPGAYFFAFSKKAFSSERGRPWEELTFSQLTSSPCAYENAMAPSAPRFKERPFIVSMGPSGVSKALAIFFKSGTFAFLLGPQPNKNPRKHAVNQLEDLLDRYPVRFQQANRGQERIVIWLRSRRGHFSIFYKTKETKNSRKGIHQQA